MLFQKKTFLFLIFLVFLQGCFDSKGDTDSNWKKRGKLSKREIFKIEKSVINPEIELDRRKVLVDKEQEVFALIKLTGDEEIKLGTAKRPDVNLSMVIDRSASMSEKNKMEYVKEAGSYVVDQLDPKDHLGIIEYDNQITTLWPISTISSPQMVKKMIKSLEPRGSTNLCGGLVEGIGQIKKDLDHRRVNRVILLSDGMTNTGITNPQSISQIVKEASSLGLTISTVGVGLDYNEDLLQDIAECGKGTYYYIENPVQMKDIFQEELNSIFKTVAKNIEVKFTGTEIVSSSEVFGYLSQKDSYGLGISVSNMYKGEEKLLLLKLNIKPKGKGKQRLGSVAVSYYDCQKDKNVKYAVDIQTVATSNEQKVINSIQKEVTVEAELIKADNDHEKYVKQFEKGKKEIAQNNITTLIDNLSKKNVKFADVKLRKKIEALELETEEMKKAEESRNNRLAYLKSSKQKFYLSKKGKRGKYLMQKGDSNSNVKRLQKKLKDHNLYTGKIDGKYSKDVKSGVEKFQKQNSMEVDGVAGPNTLKKLGLY